MRYLLDSNVLHWFAQGDNSLGPKTLALLQSGNQLYFSSITVLELNIKTMLGKYQGLSALIEGARAAGFLEANFSVSAASKLTEFPELSRHDPFDRALLAQAQEMQLQFITGDRVLTALGLGFVKDARE